MTFAVGTQTFLGVAPTGEVKNARLLADYAACPGIPTLGCPQTTGQPVEKMTDSSGAYVSVILGNTDNTRYSIAATAKKDLNGKETGEPVSATFNHYSYLITRNGAKMAPPYLTATSVYHFDEKGNRVDAGAAGVPLTSPLETSLFYYEENHEVGILDNCSADCYYLRGKGTFKTTVVTDGLVDYKITAGGGSTNPATAIASATGNYSSILTLGAIPALNKVNAVGSATVQIPKVNAVDGTTYADPATLQSATPFAIWGVKAEVVPDQVVFVNKDGYPEADVKLGYTVSPVEYKSQSINLIVYENGDYMGFISATPSGEIILSRGGAKFDLHSTYTAQLVINWGSQIEVRSAKVPLNVTMLCLIPDYDHNRVINQKDRDRALNRDTYYFWVNNDNDNGDTGGDDIPGNALDYTKLIHVNGSRDLVDFFPVLLDLKDLMDFFDPAVYTYKLVDNNENLYFAETDLTPELAGDYLISKHEYIDGNGTTYTLANAPTMHINSEGRPLSRFMLSNIREGKGIIIVEGWMKTNKPLILQVYKDSKKIFETSLNLGIDSVEKMFRHKNLMQNGDGPAPKHDTIAGELDRLDEPANFSDKECNKQNFVFVHGYNVNGQEARGWQSEMFKRMYWSGSKAKFWGITWNGADTKEILGIITAPATRNYHINAIHALDTAEALKNFINSQIKGEITVAAHSLGNMLVSKTLTDWRSIWEANNQSSDANLAKIKNYFLIDAAVAEEAYNSSIDENPNMIHPDWTLYTNRNLWASEWYALFKDQPTDQRSRLTWRGRFQNRPVGTTFYNFFSSGEEVLDIHIGHPDILDIVTSGVGRYAWALQEKLKGQLEIPGVLGSTYGGWGFNLDTYNSVEVFPDGSTKINPMLPVDANLLDSVALRTEPFFRKRFEDADLFTDTTGSNFALLNRNRLLAEAIPALTLAAGKKEVLNFGPLYNNYDMQVSFKNGWPVERRNLDDERWKHSDVREIAYLFISALFKQFVNLGGLSQW